MVYPFFISEDLESVEKKHTRARVRELTRDFLIRTGAEILCEQSYSSMGIDMVLKRAGLSKGSFYHFFASKEQFGLEVLQHYAEYFNRRLDRILKSDQLTALERLKRYTDDGIEGIRRFDFKRGCLVGNLMQELAATHPSFSQAVVTVLNGWQDRLVDCLEQAITDGDLCSTANARMYAEYFWVGWEGALMQAKLYKSVDPMNQFVNLYFLALPRTD